MNKLTRIIITTSSSLGILLATLLAQSPNPAVELRAPAPAVHRAVGHAHVLPPISQIYSRYQAKWWQWAMSLPLDRHPLTDTADCNEGQSGPVWFLGGLFDNGIADRTCTVPAGKALFFPVLNISYFLTDPADTEENARALIGTIMDNIVRMSVEIDGRPVRNLDRFRTQSKLFNVGPLPANAVFELPEGETIATVDDGVYILLQPLAPGEHTIHFSGEVFVPEEVLGFEYTFTQEATYHITAGGRNR